MIRMALLLFVTIALHSVCFAQDSSDVQETTVNAESATSVEDSGERLAQAATVANTSVSDFVALTFILLMFTNAIIVGHWALQTDRNFWAWYIFGLFTGPLAGGFMLHRAAGDKAGGKNPSGCLAAILGFGIPAAGWFIWVAILK